ncbi:hypothetical protein XELAEV_18024357mg [Xenopus laevis]|uniref:Uncharacterized protein n=1 Tax=Xenopus laevis TaxID=8355 RepID=A0A974CZX1_XENLA|nr:hypothetical protein XELAEV_18024357mg [Xenopus laevis]
MEEQSRDTEGKVGMEEQSRRHRGEGRDGGTITETQRGRKGRRDNHRDKEVKEGMEEQSRRHRWDGRDGGTIMETQSGRKGQSNRHRGEGRAEQLRRHRGEGSDGGTIMATQMGRKGQRNNHRDTEGKEGTEEQSWRHVGEGRAEQSWRHRGEGRDGGTITETQRGIKGRRNNNGDTEGKGRAGYRHGQGGQEKEG